MAVFRHTVLPIAAMATAMGAGTGMAACPWTGIRSLILHSHRYSCALRRWTQPCTGKAMRGGQSGPGIRKAKGLLPYPHC